LSEILGIIAIVIHAVLL